MLKFKKLARVNNFHVLFVCTVSLLYSGYFITHTLFSGYWGVSISGFPDFVFNFRYGIMLVQLAERIGRSRIRYHAQFSILVNLQLALKLCEINVWPALQGFWFVQHDCIWIIIHPRTRQANTVQKQHQKGMRRKTLYFPIRTHVCSIAVHVHEEIRTEYVEWQMRCTHLYCFIAGHIALRSKNKNPCNLVDHHNANQCVHTQINWWCVVVVSSLYRTNHKHLGYIACTNLRFW